MLSGREMPTMRSISIAWSMASLREMFVWVKTASATWYPMVFTGLSEVMGSWKIMEIFRPRTLHISVSSSAVKSWPFSRIWPPTIRARGLGKRPMMDSAVMLLPHPDSPTTQSVSPFFTEKLTPSTALLQRPSLREK